MRNYDIWPTDEITREVQKTRKARYNQNKTISFLDNIGGLHGDVLDIGGRNLLTERLEQKYNIKIDCTIGDLDIAFTAPKESYNFIHYNNVIEHQFNPLFTLIRIRELLKPDGCLILACPLKPKWITTAKCHFHEFDEKAYRELITRADFSEVIREDYWYQVSLKGFRLILGSFKTRQMISLLIKA